MRADSDYSPNLDQVNRPIQVVETSTPVRVSWYNPELGGPNCLTFRNGECVSKMASGLDWRGWFGRAAACVPEWDFGTTFKIQGQEFTCLDRGGKIKTIDGVPWVDLLLREPLVPFGTVVQAEVWR